MLVEWFELMNDALLVNTKASDNKVLMTTFTDY